MSDIKIYGSAGSIRYPENHSDVSQEISEEVRDLFFNSVYINSGESGISLFFNASTGTPEQFIGLIKTRGGQDPVGEAANRLQTKIKELGWTIADENASEGQKVFTNILNTEPKKLERYSPETLNKAVEDNGIVDLGTPDIQSAVGVTKWLIANTELDASVTLAGDGRNQYLADVDIVVVPGVTEYEIIGINGSDEYLNDLFVETKADNLIQIICSTIPHPKKSTAAERSRYAITYLENLIYEHGLNGYLVKSKSELREEKFQQSLRGGIVTAVLGLLGAFAIFGGLGNFTSGYRNTVVGETDLPFYTVTTLLSSLNMDIPQVDHSILFWVSMALLVGWIVVIASLIKNVKEDAVGSDQPPLKPDIQQHYSNQINSIMTEVKETPGIETAQFADALSARSTRLPRETLFLSHNSDKIKRFSYIGLVGLATGIGGGLIGFGFAEFIDNILAHWAIMAEVLIIITIIAILIGIGVIVWKYVNNDF